MPGRIQTPLVAGMSKEQARANLLGRMGDSWDVAWLAVFLASDESRWITGVTIPVDGGYLHTPVVWDYFEGPDVPTVD
jgi:NAD(P)-dependent dehydrogenase (short-subunit alcohol dehydrogenase family)